MAESNATQVILTDDGLKIIKAQSTADSVAGGVANLNDPNLMSVIEKQNNIGQFAGLTSQYNVLVQNAKDDGIDTTAVTTAYNDLNNFMANILADPDHASDVDRATYKKYQDAYNEELAKLQSALQNNTNNKFTSAANATSQAASTANQAFSAANGAFSQAQLIGSQADSAIAVQSQAAAKAQSTADNAFSQAQVIGSQASADISINSMATAKAQSTADNAFSQAQAVGSQASAEIATQSEATLKAQSTADSAFKQAQSATDYTDKQIASQASAVSEVSKNASEASLQANSALDAANSANAEITNLKGGSTLTIAKLEDGLGTKVDNSDFSTYKTQTASQFAETVKEADFKTYQTQTSKLIEAKVDNGTYQSDKTQTAKDISSKVSSGDFNTYKTQTADLINDKVSNSEYASDKTQTASEIADRVSNSAFSTYQTQTASQIASKVDNGDFTTYKTQTADLIASKVATKDFSAYQATTAKSIESKVESSDFNTYKTQTADAISSKVESSNFQALQNQVQNSAVGTNLIIQSDLKYGCIFADGSLGSNTIDFHSDNYIPTNGATVFALSSPDYVFKGNGADDRIAMYDSDKNYLGSQPITSPTQTLSKSNVAYIRLSINSADEGNTTSDSSDWLANHRYKLEKGSVATDWSLNPEEQATQSQVTQLSGEITQKVDSGDFSTYKTQTAGLIAEKVSNGDFSTYKTQTADLISSKVATKDFSAYQATTAKSIESKVESSDFNTYKIQTAGLISSKVDSGDFSTYKTQTDKLIEAKVDNGTYQSDKTQTANDIASKVANNDFETYKSQTADLISSKVATKDFNTYTSQTATAINSKVASSDFNTYKTQTANLISSKVESSDFNTYKTQTAGMISSKVESSNFQALQAQVQNSAVGTNLLTNTGDLSANWGLNGTVDASQKPAILHYPTKTLTNGTNTLANQQLNDGLFQPSTTYTASFYAKGTGTFIFYCYPGVAQGEHSDSRAEIKLTSEYKLYTITFTTNPNISGNKTFLIRQEYSPSATDQNTVEAYVYGFKLEKGSVATDWSLNPEDQATQSQITQLSGDINLRVTKDDLIDQINIQAGKTLISSSGQLTLSGKNIYFDSTNPVIIPSANIEKLLVNKTLTAADISANTFTTNNGTFTVDKNGSITAKNMTLTGGTLTSPTINASKINSATINGTTINAGDIINNANNTSHFYPTTISNNGHIYTVQFNSSDAMQTDLSTGSLTTKYRAVNSTGTQYEAYDTLIQANQIALFAGHTNGKDMSFTQSVTGSNQDGYMLLSPLNGMTLHGDTQQITFNGTSADTTPKGIIITPYGNINPNGTQNIWYVGNGPTMKTASFGIDGSGANNIQFNRSLDIGNFNINTYHTITSSDNGPIHFNRNDGKSVDIYASTVHYDSLVKSSLLSLKNDVKKADTAYWAQLVNSIDLATYQYKTDDNTSHLRLSSIVDDVNVTKQWQLPDVFISRDENGRLNGVDDSVLLNATLATVQEQQKQIDQLNGHNMELEARLNKLEEKLNG